MSLTISIDYIEGGLTKHSTVSDVIQVTRQNSDTRGYHVTMLRSGRVPVVIDQVVEIRTFNQNGFLIETTKLNNADATLYDTNMVAVEEPKI